MVIVHGDGDLHRTDKGLFPWRCFEAMKKVCGSICEFLFLSFATILSVVGVYFFRIPNHFSTGGAAGIGIILGELTPGVSAGTYTAFLNLLFVAIGFIFIGKAFGWRSIYCSLLFSAGLKLFEALFPLSAPLTDQKMLELLCASILPALSSAFFSTWAHQQEARR